jgi:multisubunit Na+/H+ antiporter MnhE subunit
MNPVQLGNFTGQFVGSLLFAVVWLIICKAVPSLRKQLGVSYGVAVVFAFVPPLVTTDGLSIAGILAAGLCAVLLFWQYKRAKAKLLVEANKVNTPQNS